MADDEKRYGLDIPDEVKRQGKGLLASAMKSPPPKTQAEPLTLTDGNKAMLHGRELLKQIQHETQQLAKQGVSNTGCERIASAAMCLVVSEELQAKMTDRELEYMSNGHALLVLGYLYGNLISPSQQDYNELTKHFIAGIRRQTGFWGVSAERERGRQWMREQATEIWSKDKAQEKRIGTVVAEVKTLIEAKAKSDEPARKHWAKSRDSIKKAIRDVAPNYARKQGRPRKK